MKRTIQILSILLILVSFSAQAQIGFGVTAGASTSNFSGDVGDVDMKLGFLGGVFLDVPLGPTLALHPELLYMQKGAKTQYYDGDMTQKLNYIEIPLLVKFKFSVPLSPVTPFIFAGPSVGFFLNGTNSFEEGILDGIENDIENVKTFDLGLSVGAGVGFKMGTGELNANLRYNLGLMNIDDTDGTDISMKNNYIALLIGYEFSLL